MWDVATGKCVATLKGHSYGVQCVTVCPDGRRIVSTSHDCTIKVWGVPSSQDFLRRWTKDSTIKTREDEGDEVASQSSFRSFRRRFKQSENAQNVIDLVKKQRSDRLKSALKSTGYVTQSSY